MAATGENGVKHTYALSETHKDVNYSVNSAPPKPFTDSFPQMLEKSLIETDPEIAAIMVRISHVIFVPKASDCQTRNSRFSVNVNPSS